MPSRLSQFKVFPWTGGLVTSIDESLIQPGQLTRADNVLFSTQGTRLKRDGIDADWDSLDIAVVNRSSSGTSRTLTTTGYEWTIGDQFALSGAGNSNYNTGIQTATVTGVSSSVSSTVTPLQSTSTVTISQAAPGVVTWTGHGLSATDPIFLTTSGTLPAPLAPNTVYYVKNPTADTFEVALTSGGASITTTTAGSGTHTAYTAEASFNWTTTPISENDNVYLTTSGTLPAPLSANKIYFAVNVQTDSFSLATTPSGDPILTTTVNSGTITAFENLYDVVTYTFLGAASFSESQTAETAAVITLATKIIALWDYWYDNATVKEQKLMAFTSAGALFEIEPDTGVRTKIPDNGTGYTVPSTGILTASLVTFDNRLIVACEGSTNVMKHFFPSELGGTDTLEDVVNQDGFEATPKASFLQVHLGRLFCNDNSNKDRLHYCQTGAYNVWQGAGDSGAFDIGPGDGDPQGLTAIFPPFKGVLFVAKRTKLYRVMGAYPEEMGIERVSSSLGCVSHQAVAAVDQDDVVFVSDKGIHSAVATNTYGDFAQTYVSSDIQKSITEDWNRSRQRFIQAAYLPQINSIGFCVAEEADSSQQDLWLYNFALKMWYRWPDINCSSICTSNDADKQRFYFGRNDGRVSKSFTDNNSDISANGSESAIVMTIATGLIFPTGDPLAQGAFKRLALVYKPSGSYTLNATFKIDNFSAQSLVYNEAGLGQDLLGTTFVLNQSVLGLSQVTAAYTQPIDGYGRGFKLTLQQSGVNEFGEILGFIVFFEPTEPVYLTRAGDDS